MLSRLEAKEHGRVAALFPPSFPNLAFVQAVLEEKIPGQVWAAWEGERPVTTVISTGSPFCFVAGATPPRRFEAALALLPERPCLTIVGPVSPEAEAMAVAHGFVVTERVQYGLARPADVEGLQIEVPAAYRLARVDADLFQRTLWKEMTYGIFGSVESYLKHHYGFCLLEDDRPVSESHGIVAGGLVELGAFTSPAHRGLGLAVACCRQAVQFGVTLGYRPVSTQFTSKVESQRLSEAAGLRREFTYRVLTRSSSS